MTRTVYSVDCQGRLQVRAFVPGQPSGIGFRTDGELLVVSMFDQNLLAIPPTVGDRLRLVAHVGGVVRGQINDMAVDARGRAYIGSFGYNALYDGEDGTSGASLALVDEHGSVRCAAEGLKMPNGMAFSSNGRKLVVAETAAQQLTVFDVSPNGDLSNRRIFAQLPKRPPDGICMDRDDAVWVACFSAREFIRFLEGGTVTDRISIESGWATSCVLGGSDGRTLFCAVADTDSRRMRLGQSSGYIACATVAVSGVAS